MVRAETEPGSPHINPTAVCRRYVHFRWLRDQLLAHAETEGLRDAARQHCLRNPLPDKDAGKLKRGSLSAQNLRGKLRAADLDSSGRREVLLSRWQQHMFGAAPQRG